MPKEQQADIAPNDPDQPNFKVQITFQNGTVADPSKTRPARRAPNPVSAGSLVRSQLLKNRAAPSASPAPPSDADMVFLGNTTDGNSVPFDGEETPFFISFQGTTTSTSRLLRRDDSGDNITSVIPPPELNSDGTAAAAPGLLLYGGAFDARPPQATMDPLLHMQSFDVSNLAMMHSPRSLLRIGRACAHGDLQSHCSPASQPRYPLHTHYDLQSGLDDSPRNDQDPARPKNSLKFDSESAKEAAPFLLPRLCESR